MSVQKGNVDITGTVRLIKTKTKNNSPNQSVSFLDCLLVALVDPYYGFLSAVQTMEGELEMKAETVSYLEDNMEWGTLGANN